ncbi:Hypothetical_protein [Hexamita inflata]|uniref:Hypothetical_protein n=1 Tax=Hexamita inflata TaxID=28002 RepID=A0AA86RPE7_9EUKA|nr:Hypothetical protein HINF_LOCUS63247 [Hexamita inflata]
MQLTHHQHPKPSVLDKFVQQHKKCKHETRFTYVYDNFRSTYLQQCIQSEQMLNVNLRLRQVNQYAIIRQINSLSPTSSDMVNIMCCSTIFIYTCIVETNQHTTKYYYIVLSIIALFAFENGRSCYKHIIIERHGFRCGHIPNLSRNQINHKFADFQNQKVKHARNEVNYIPLVSYYILNPTKNLNQNKPLSYCVLRAEYISCGIDSWEMSFSVVIRQYYNWNVVIGPAIL